MKQQPDIRAHVLAGLDRMQRNDFNDVPARLVAAVTTEPGLNNPDLRPVHTRQLTEKQLMVVAAVSHGLDDHEIADVLGIAYDTVRSHLKTASLKLAAKNRAHAACIALRAGTIR